MILCLGPDLASTNFGQKKMVFRRHPWQIIGAHRRAVPKLATVDSVGTLARTSA
ncbi:MAG: hypothetical protein ACREIC_01595 [Limisphaerales bacterium]